MKILVPVARGWIPEVVERVEDRKLHVRVNAVDHRDPPVAEIEEDGVLVRDSVRPDHSTRRAVEEEPAVCEPEPMNADPPGPPRLRGRQVRVGHHDSLLAAASDELHPGVLVDVDVGRALCEHLLERVRAAVERGEHEHVGDVVEEPRAGPVVPAIAVPHAPGEEVEDPLVPDHPCIEDGPVPLHGSRCDDGRVGDAHRCQRGDQASGFLRSRGHELRLERSGVYLIDRLAEHSS